MSFPFYCLALFSYVLQKNTKIKIKLWIVLKELVGPARFERATFTQIQREAASYGFLMTAPKLRHTPEGQQTR
jgi:hypothetical protein